MTALVTGGGMLAGEVARVLLRRGFTVAILTRDRDCAKLPEALRRRVRVYQLDITDADAVRQTFAEVKPDVVIHTAALTTLQMCIENPQAAFQVNVLGTMNLFDAAISAGVRAFVHISTDKVIGSTTEPAAEDAAYQPGPEPYSISKAAADELAVQFYAKRLPVIVVRICNMIGRDLNFSRLVPATSRRILTVGKVTVYASRAGVLREYIDARDVALAIAGLVNLKLQGALADTVFNIGSGVRLSSEVVVRQLIDISGRPLSPVVDEPPVGLSEAELGSQWIDSTRLRRVLPEWQPRPIEETLRYAYDFYTGLFKTHDTTTKPGPEVAQSRNRRPRGGVIIDVGSDLAA